jgi:hypothetical protein
MHAVRYATSTDMGCIPDGMLFMGKIRFYQAFFPTGSGLKGEIFITAGERSVSYENFH